MPHNLRTRILATMLIVVVLGGTIGLGWRAWHRPSGDYSHLPVVFVHGQGLYSGSFRPMMRALHAAGWPREYLAAIDFRPSDGPNVPAAQEQLAPFIDELLEEAQAAHARHSRDASANDRKPEAPPMRVAVVAHSMGSLSSRWYIANMHPERVAVWISIAGPNHGSTLSCPPRAGSGDLDMCPPSGLLTTLNGGPGPDVDETPYGLGQDAAGTRSIPPGVVERPGPGDPADGQPEDQPEDDATARAAIWYLTVRLPSDEYIEPADSTVVDGAGGLQWQPQAALAFEATRAGNFLMLDPVPHDDMPADERVIGFVRSALEHFESAGPRG